MHVHYSPALQFLDIQILFGGVLSWAVAQGQGTFFFCAFHSRVSLVDGLDAH
jgi:hypothetical protein